MDTWVGGITKALRSSAAVACLVVVVGSSACPAIQGTINPPAPTEPAAGKPFRNSLNMHFVWIEPGSFMMGSPDGNRPPDRAEEVQRRDDETPHTVTLTRGYHMGVHLVTQHQWEQVMGREANRSRFRGR